PPLAGPSPIPTDAAQVPGGLAPGGLAPSMARRIPQVLPALVLFCLAGLAGAPALAADRPAAPDFALSDQDGRLVRLSDLRGKPVVLTFLYTHCPDTCPRTLGHLLTALKDRPGDAAVVTVTVDPARDDKARLAEYAKQWPAGWRFLTGPEAQVGKVWAQYGVSVRRDEETGHHHHGHHMGYTITHSNVVLVLDAAGRITERISGAWSAADVSGALAQARQAEGIRWAAMPLQALRDFLDKCGAYATRNPVAFAGIVLLIALPGILLPLFLFRTFVLN
ncbi:MAG: SCO family protein, partial [Candidatus Sericytochromatia bacterium]|nr:SCO family protein [Candidatus Tanganyikabacteria bacterium]